MLGLVPRARLEPADILTTRKSWSEEEQAWRLRLLRPSTQECGGASLPSRAMQASRKARISASCSWQSEDFRIDLQDLDNWYYQFKVSLERAARMYTVSRGR